MSDKQIFVSFIGGGFFGLVGGALIIPIQWLLHANDGGDDIGWGVLWIVLIAISAICGFLITSKWARKRYPDFQS